MVDVKMVKLCTGEDIFGEVVDDITSAHIVIKKPVQLIPTNSGIAMVGYPNPMLAKENQDITLWECDIVFMVEASDKVVTAYNEKMTGLVLPPASKLEL